MTIPKITHTSRSTATTYHFRADNSPGGWALATINDTTGELSIQSDWGEWAYRWTPKHTGCETFSHFIGERTCKDAQGLPEGRYYLADKLTSCDRKLREHFSPEKTVARLREGIIEKRRTYPGKVSRDQARELWDAIADIEHTDDVHDFVDSFYKALPWDERELVWPYAIECESLCYEPTHSYLVLRDAIVPALIEAVREHLDLNKIVSAALPCT